MGDSYLQSIESLDLLHLLVSSSGQSVIVFLGVDSFGTGTVKLSIDVNNLEVDGRQ